jgi:hypothetical protein
MEKITDIKDMVGLDENGEFDINLVPENIRDDVKKMAEQMIAMNKPKGKTANKRKKKPRQKVKKNYGQNKKRKK